MKKHIKYKLIRNKRKINSKSKNSGGSGDIGGSGGVVHSIVHICQCAVRKLIDALCGAAHRLCCSSKVCQDDFGSWLKVLHLPFSTFHLIDPCCAKDESMLSAIVWLCGCAMDEQPSDAWLLSGVHHVRICEDSCIQDVPTL
eukprot:2053497-Amphidinium_carterae.1